jgi:hypothetical protein
MHPNKLIPNSKKNLNSVKAAVRLVHAQKPQAIQLMGGVTVLSKTVLAAISFGSVTVGQAADRVEQGLAKTIPMTTSFLNNLVGLGGCRTVILKIFNYVT